MKIIGDTAVLNYFDRKFFEVPERIVAPDALRCSEVLDELSEQKDVLTREYAEYQQYVPVRNEGIWPTGYRAALVAVERKLRRATNVGAQVLIYETEQYLAGNADVSDTTPS